MTCCKSTSTGVGIPTAAPTSNDPDIYIERPSGQIWVWTGTTWILPPIGAVSFNSTTRTLTVGSSSVVVPKASTTEFGLVTIGADSPIQMNGAGELIINCATLITHCNLATKEDLQEAIANIPPPTTLTGLEIIQKLVALPSEQLAGLACRLNSESAGNLLQCRADGLYYGIEAAAATANLYFDPDTGNNSNDGTEASPLATQDEGIRRNKVGTAWTAWLAEGKTHEWRSSWSDGAGQSITQRPYGDMVDTVMATLETPSATWYYAAELPVTTVKFISDAVDSSGRENPKVHEQTGITPRSALKSYAIKYDCSDVANAPTAAINLGFLAGDSLYVSLTGGGVILGASFYLTQSVTGSQQVDMYNVELSGAGNKLLNLNLASSHNIDIRTIGTVGSAIPNTSGALTYKARTPPVDFGQYINNATGRITANVFSSTDIGV